MCGGSGASVEVPGIDRTGLANTGTTALGTPYEGRSKRVHSGSGLASLGTRRVRAMDMGRSHCLAGMGSGRGGRRPWPRSAGTYLCSDREPPIPLGGAEGRGRHHPVLLVPEPTWWVVMWLAHNSPLTGPMGPKKQLQKVLQQFYWLGV